VVECTFFTDSIPGCSRKSSYRLAIRNKYTPFVSPLQLQTLNVEYRYFSVSAYWLLNISKKIFIYSPIKPTHRHPPAIPKKPATAG